MGTHREEAADEEAGRHLNQVCWHLIFALEKEKQNYEGCSKTLIIE
jgi:hypothetical protein